MDKLLDPHDDTEEEEETHKLPLLQGDLWLYVLWILIRYSPQLGKSISN